MLTYDTLQSPVPDETNYVVVPNVPVQLCPANDSACLKPYRSITSGPDGIALFDAPPTGPFFVEANFPADGGAPPVSWTGDGKPFMPIAFYPAFSHDQFLQVPGKLYVPMLTLTGAQKALNFANAPPLEPTDGFLFAQVFDCLSQKLNVSGVQFALTGANAIYERNFKPTANVDSTDNLGFGIFINLTPPGTPLLTATLKAGGEQIGSASGAIRAGWITLVELVPTPKGQ